MKVVLIWAEANDGVIGFEGSIPWDVPEDLEFFKYITTKHPVIFGRKTWESLPKRPLPNRHCIVITSQENYEAEGAVVVGSLEEAFKAAEEVSTIVFVAGGSSIYHDALPYATWAWKTEIDVDVDGDTFAPTLDPEDGWYKHHGATHWSVSGNGTLHRRSHYVKA